MSLLDSAKKPQLDALTGCRFIAASLVVWYHYFPHALQTVAPFRAVISRGYMAVSFFFVLSGFVLAYNYSGSEFDSQKRVRFWIARFCRIYPTYLLALVLAAPFHLYAMFAGLLEFSLKKWLAGGILSALCLQAWLPQTAQSWNGPGWSISCEAFFYAVFPFLIARLHRQSPSRLIRTCTLLWIIGLIPPAALWTTGHLGLHSGWQAWESSTSVEELFVLTFPLFHLPAFVAGMAAGSLFVKHGPLSPGTSLASVLAATTVTVLVCSSPLPRESLWNGILAPVFALLIYALTTKSPWTALLTRRSMQLLGDASYAQYILQYPVFLLLSLKLQVLGLTEARTPLTKFACVFVALVAASIATSAGASRLGRRLSRKLAILLPAAKPAMPDPVEV